MPSSAETRQLSAYDRLDQEVHGPMQDVNNWNPYVSRGEFNIGPSPQAQTPIPMDPALSTVGGHPSSNQPGQSEPQR